MPNTATVSAPLPLRPPGGLFSGWGRLHSGQGDPESPEKACDFRGMSDTPPLSPTERPGAWDALERMDPEAIVAAMGQCDREAQAAVAAIGPAIARAIAAAAERVIDGGRVFYLGAGTSGRLGILDASEIPPTFGVEGTFIGLIAGGDGAIRKAVEGAEDNRLGGVDDLKAHGAGPQDVVVGIAASGRTPYVLGAMDWARDQGILTLGILPPRRSAPPPSTCLSPPTPARNSSPAAPASRPVPPRSSSSTSSLRAS